MQNFVGLSVGVFSGWSGWIDGCFSTHSHRFVILFNTLTLFGLVWFALIWPAAADCRYAADKEHLKAFHRHNLPRCLAYFELNTRPGQTFRKLCCWLFSFITVRKINEYLEWQQAGIHILIEPTAPRLNPSNYGFDIISKPNLISIDPINISQCLEWFITKFCQRTRNTGELVPLPGHKFISGVWYIWGSSYTRHRNNFSEEPTPGWEMRTTTHLT